VVSGEADGTSTMPPSSEITVHPGALFGVKPLFSAAPVLQIDVLVRNVDVHPTK
jgi:hypothetical protein